MKRFFLLIGLICFISLSTHAQIMFQKHYGGSGDDYGSTCLQTSDGGYIVTGSTDSYGLGGWDIYVIRTNEYGETLWTKTYGGSSYDVSTDIIATDDGNYAICGITDSYGYGNHDVYLIKIDQNGDTLWAKTYGGTGSDAGYSIVQTLDNGIVISGNTGSFSPVTSSIYLIKTDENGDTLWTKTYYKQDVNTGYDVIETNDTGLLIAVTLSNTILTHDYMLIKTNMNGDTIWTKVYDKGGDDWLSCAIELSGGDFIISGRTNSMGYGGYDTFLARYNNSGDEIWFKNYGGTEDDLGGRIVVTNDLGIVFSGSTYSFGHGSSDAYLIKTNLSGDTLWTKTYGGIANDNGGSIEQTMDGGLIIGGSSTSFGNGSEVYLIKTNSFGFVGIEQIYNILNEVKIYPNPNNGVFTIEQEKWDANYSSLRIFDLNGRLVYFRLDIFQNSNIENIELPQLNSGEYFLTISSKNHMGTSKLIIKK